MEMFFGNNRHLYLPEETVANDHDFDRVCPATKDGNDLSNYDNAGKDNRAGSRSISLNE